MNSGFLIACGVAIVLASVLLVGILLPRQHVASRACRLDLPPEEVWRIITDFEAQTVWRPELQRVERLAGQKDHEMWREFEGPDRYLTYETLEALPPQRLVRRIVDEKLPFSGSWTFEITPEGQDSCLQITEQGEVYNPLFRFVSRFLIGHTASIQKYIGALERHLARRVLAA